MTTSLSAASAALPEPLPVALTDADADRVSAAISAARTESTRRIYAYTCGQWARWCAARGPRRHRAGPGPRPAHLRPAHRSRSQPGGGARNRIDTLARGATALNRHLVVSFPEKLPANLKDAVQVA